MSLTFLKDWSSSFCKSAKLASKTLPFKASEAISKTKVNQSDIQIQFKNIKPIVRLHIKNIKTKTDWFSFKENRTFTYWYRLFC